LSQINLNNIEQIELVEGPLAVNYGSNALAGTLNIITKKNSRDKYDIYLNGYTENIGTYNLDAGVSFSAKKHFLSLSGGRNFFDGWHPSDNFFPEFEQPVADSTRYKSWNPKTQYFGRAQYNYQFDKVKLGYKGEIFKEKITNRGLPRAPYNETAFDDYYYTTRIDNALFLDGNIGQNKFWKITTAYNYYKRQKNTYSKDLTTLEESLTENSGEQDTSKYQQWMSRGNFSKSSAEDWFNYEVGYDVNIESASGERIENNKQSIGDFALFATAEIEPVKSFIIRPGLRYGYNSAYKTPLIPSLNLKYGIRDFTLRASYARGFRAPGVRELYFYFVDVNHYIVGNENLRAEYGHNISFNTQHRKVLENKVVVKTGVSAFYNNIQNLITLALADPATQEYTYANIGKFQTVGGNVEFKLNWKTLDFNLAAGYTGRSNQLEDATAPETFSFYPEVTSNLVYKWEKTGLQAALFYKYQGRLPSYVVVDDVVRENFIEDYHTLDMNVSKSFYKNIFNLTIGCKNLLNVQNVYSNVAGGGVHSSSSTSTPVATGRVLFARLNINISPSKLNKR
jgi:outer membrane receptor for ferrienterochelin and colicins